MKIEIKKRKPLSLGKQILLPIMAILITFFIASFFILLAGANVFKAFYYLFMGAAGSRFSLLETLIKMSPLCLTGLAVTVAFKAKFWNIGAEGQLLSGAICAAFLGTLPISSNPYIHISVILTAGFITGGLFASLPAFLKVKFKVDDVVTTLMLNYVILYFMKTMLDTFWRDQFSGWPHSPEILPSAHLPKLLSQSRFHIGFIVSILAAVLIFTMFRFTKLGFRIKAVGHNPDASRYCGINPSNTIIAAGFISGGLAGLAGVGEVCGMQFYLVEGISPGYGYYGVAIAMLANLNPIGVIFTSFFFAIFVTGSQMMSRYTGVPVYITEIIQGVSLLAMMAVMLLNKYKVKIRKS